MKTVIIKMLHKVGSEFLIYLLEYVISLLAARKDNSIGEQSISEVQAIIERNTVNADPHADTLKSLRKRYGGRG